MGWLEGWKNRVWVNLTENGGGTKANWAELFDVFYNSPPMAADAQCQAYYRPAVRYAGGDHDHTYISTVTSQGKILIHQWDEADRVFSKPVELWDFVTTDDHNGCAVLVLQHQTGDLAVHNETILVVAAEHWVGIYSRRSDNAEDISSWGVSNTIEESAYSDFPQLIETDDGVIWCIGRYKGTGADDKSTFISTLTLGANPDDDVWSTPFIIAEQTGEVIYHKPVKDDVDGDDFHIAFNQRTDGNLWQEDIYYAKKVGSLEGTADGNTANKLIDSGTNFTTAGVVAGWCVMIRNPADPSGVVHGLISAVDDANTLSLTTFAGGALDLFPNGNEDYTIYRWEEADGTLIEIPMDWSDAAHTPDLVYTTLANHYTYLWDIKMDGSGNPYIIFLDSVSLLEDAVADIYRTNYVGAAWVEEDTDINCMRMFGGGHHSGAEMDEGNPDVIFAAVPDGSNNTQIEAWEKADGENWWIADGANGTTAINGDGKITQVAPGNNFRPIHVVNGAGRFEWLWFYTLLYKQNMSTTSLRFAYPGFSNGKYIGLYKNALPDFGDLRFTDDEDNLLGDSGQPWIQEKTDSWRALVWQNIGTIPADAGVLSAFIYYGNAGATNDEDQDVMDAVFKTGGVATGDTTCDGFDGSGALDSNKWTITGSPALDGSSAAVFEQNEEVKQNVANFADLTRPVEIRVRWKLSATLGQYAVIGAWDADGSDRVGIMPWSTPNGVMVNTRAAGSATNNDVNNVDITNYHWWAITWKTGQVKYYWENLDQANKDLILARIHTTTVPTVDLMLYLFMAHPTVDLYVDAIFARPWTDPLPLITSSTLGEERRPRRILISHI